MNQTDFTIAPFHITDDKSCMAMISDGMIHFFAINGQSIDRKDLNLPEVFVLCFNNGTSRSYVMVNEKEECKEGKIYVINKDNRVIFTSDDKELGTFYRLTDDSVILGIKDIITSSNLLTSSNNKFGHLIANNELTDCQYIGTIGDFYFFCSGNNVYHIYTINIFSIPDDEANRYEYDKEKWKYKILSRDFIQVQTFNCKYIVLWETTGPYLSYCRMNVIYFSEDKQNRLNIISYDVSYDYNCKKKSFLIHSDLSKVNWEKDIQILTDDDTIILHHKNINSSYKGFTIIVEYDGSNYEFVLANQERLGWYHNQSINRFANSLILLEDYYRIMIYDKTGKLVSQTSKDYDYQKKRAAITDYAIFEQKMSVQHIKSPIRNNYVRYGAINTETLNVAVPPSFSKIDFLVLEEPSSKHYREKGQYQIYIKVCLECISSPNTSAEYWGLFNDSAYILPCFYKNIERLRIKKQDLILIEDHIGHKGLFVNDKILVPCMYSSIDILGYYLLMKKIDGTTDILYTYNNLMMLGNFTSINQASIKLNFKETFVSEESIIVEKNGKYGLICHGELINNECLYDKVEVIRAYPKQTVFASSANCPPIKPIWFSVQIGMMKGVYGNLGYECKSEVKYKNVDVVDCHTFNPQFHYNTLRTVILLDGRVYTSENESSLICQKEDLSFRGFLSGDVLAFSDDKGTKLELFDYQGKSREYDVVDSEGNSLDKNEIDTCNDKYAVLLYFNMYSQDYTTEEYVFSFSENKIVNSPFYQEDEEDECDDYEPTGIEDDYDYERDTYYALGGDDYDSFKENGGSIDDMMDRMGL